MKELYWLAVIAASPTDIPNSAVDGVVAYLVGAINRFVRA